MVTKTGSLNSAPPAPSPAKARNSRTGGAGTNVSTRHRPPSAIRRPHRNTAA